MHTYRLASLLVFAVLAVPLWAADGGGADNPKCHNELLLEKWRTDPEHYARLKRDLQQFWALPRERQEKIRELDRELQDCDSQTQKRLWETLERYAAWIDRLPEAEQQRILGIVDKSERLQAIKLTHEQQWLERLPSKDREYLQTLPDEKRSAEIARLQQEDRQRQLRWQQVLKLRPDLRPRPSKPDSLKDFPPEVSEFVVALLTPMLNPEEKQHFKNSQGWPALALTILDLTDKHPVLPPVNGTTAVVRYEQLPRLDKQTLSKQKLEPKNQWFPLMQAEKKWPDFALTFTQLAAKNNYIMTKPLGASRPPDFAPETEVFIKERLLASITPVEAERLKWTEGKWPEYPKVLHEFAKKYNLIIPGMSLPGPRELWESARTAALPEVPEHILREFVGELSPEDLAKLNISPMDPSSPYLFSQEFFIRHPKELKRLQEHDQMKGNQKKK